MAEREGKSAGPAAKTSSGLSTARSRTTGLEWPWRSVIFWARKSTCRGSARSFGCSRMHQPTRSSKSSGGLTSSGDRAGTELALGRGEAAAEQRSQARMGGSAERSPRSDGSNSASFWPGDGRSGSCGDRRDARVAGARRLPCRPRARGDVVAYPRPRGRHRGPGPVALAFADRPRRNGETKPLRVREVDDLALWGVRHARADVDSVVPSTFPTWRVTRTRRLTKRSASSRSAGCGRCCCWSAT